VLEKINLPRGELAALLPDSGSAAGDSAGLTRRPGGVDARPRIAEVGRASSEELGVDGLFALASASTTHVLG
jgi:hypothetical protein